MKNLLFIPCFNDIENCKKILNEIDEICNVNFDILIINDGSSQTLKFKSKNFKIKVINLRNNFGIGFGVKLALNYALNNNYKKFCRIDSDGEHDPKFIENFFNKLDDNDFVVGCRKISNQENFFKIFSKKFINLIMNKSFYLKFDDYNCGMMSLGKRSMQILDNYYLINYPEPQIILKLSSKKFKYSVIQIIQRQRFLGISSINFFRGFDFFLVTLFLILNHILNKSDD